MNKIKPDYYKGTNGLDVIDACYMLNLDFLQGNVVKYTVRYKNKGGVEDLRKAQEYLRRLIEYENGGPDQEYEKEREETVAAMLADLENMALSGNDTAARLVQEYANICSDYRALKSDWGDLGFDGDFNTVSFAQDVRKVESESPVKTIVVNGISQEEFEIAVKQMGYVRDEHAHLGDPHFEQVMAEILKVAEYIRFMDANNNELALTEIADELEEIAKNQGLPFRQQPDMILAYIKERVLKIADDLKKNQKMDVPFVSARRLEEELRDIFGDNKVEEEEVLDTQQSLSDRMEELAANLDQTRSHISPQYVAQEIRDILKND